MSASFYQIRQCINPVCGLRYPLVEAHPFGERCPLCLGETRMEIQRSLDQEALPSPLTHLPKGDGNLKISALLDNVRSAWNVGAIFRTADGLGVEKLYLCGITPTPGNASVRKTALGAENSVKWEAARNALELAKRLKSEGHLLWALEQDKRAENINVPATSATENQGQGIILMVGNEVTGVDPALLDLCEQIVFIPMRGQKRSLNVEVAFGVAVWALKRGSDE
jgi:23S rRNA (guanosine2251-2'-O)-methyltransferase